MDGRILIARTPLHSMQRGKNVKAIKCENGHICGKVENTVGLFSAHGVDLKL